jgi:hypothetical protein
MTVDLGAVKVRGIVENPDGEDYFVFGDGGLYRVGAGSVRAEPIATVPSLREVSATGIPLELELYSRGPWVFVAERFGVNAALVDTRSGAVREHPRKEYHSDISAFAAGFLERDGRILLITQTEWNRLDIFDAETGQNLTEREVYSKQVGVKDDRAIFENKNFRDYFYSTLYISPGSKYFLSTGWVWQPTAVTMLFNVDEYLKTWDCGGTSQISANDQWDSPAVFIDDDTFVLANDDLRLNPDWYDPMDEAELAANPYHQFSFYRTSGDDGETSPFVFDHSLDVQVFPAMELGMISGQLHFDPVSQWLISMTRTAGAYALSLDGRIVAHLPEVNLGELVFQQPAEYPDRWQYSATHRCFITWNSGVQERRFSE